MTQAVFQKWKSSELIEVSNFDDVITETNSQGFGWTEEEKKTVANFTNSYLLEFIPNDMKETAFWPIVVSWNVIIF